MMERIKITYANMREVSKMLKERGKTCDVRFMPNPRGIMSPPVSAIVFLFETRALYAGSTVIFHDDGKVEYEA